MSTTIKFEPVYSKSEIPELFEPSKKIKDIVKIDVSPNQLAKDIFSLIDQRAMIAGGAGFSLIELEKRNIKPKPYGDIDIFFMDKKSLINTYDKLIKNGFSVSPDSTHYQIQMKKDGFHSVISLVKHRFYGSVIECLDSFDFTVAQIGLTHKEVFANKYSLKDEETNSLCVHVIRPTTDWLPRLVKYIKKGYEPSVQCLNEIEAFYKKPVLKRIPKKNKANMTLHAIEDEVARVVHVTTSYRPRNVGGGIANALEDVARAPAPAPIAPPAVSFSTVTWQQLNDANNLQTYYGIRPIITSTNSVPEED